MSVLSVFFPYLKHDKVMEKGGGGWGTKQVSEINTSSRVLTIKIREGDVMMGIMVCFMCGLEGKISK